MKKSFFLVVLLAFVVSSALCQVRFSLYFSGKSMLVNYPTYEKFRITFNDYLKSANIYKEDLEKFGFSKGISLGGSVFAGNSYGILGYSTLSAQTKVEYNSGFGRIFIFDFNRMTMDFGYGLETSIATLSAYASLESGYMHLTSCYLYGDKNISLGFEKTLNRVYETLSIKFAVGLRAIVPISKKMSILGDVGYLIGGGEYNKMAIKDLNPLLLMSQSGRELPDSYLDYVNGGEYSGDYVKNDFKGLIFGLGLTYTLFEID